MVGSYSQPIKANKIISYGTRDFQHPIRTAATKRWRLTISTRAPSMRTACELRISSSWRTELEIFNIQSEQQQQGDDNLRLANLHLHLPSVRTACELRISSSWRTYGTRDFQHSIRTPATKKWRLTIFTNVRHPCELLENCEFAIHGVRNSEKPLGETNKLIVINLL